MEVNENYYGLKENWFPLGGTSSSAWQSQIPDDERFKLANFLNNTQSALQSDIRNGGVLGNAIYKAYKTDSTYYDPSFEATLMGKVFDQSIEFAGMAGNYCPYSTIVYYSNRREQDQGSTRELVNEGEDHIDVWNYFYTTYMTSITQGYGNLTRRWSDFYVNAPSSPSGTYGYEFTAMRWMPGDPQDSPIQIGNASSSYPYYNTPYATRNQLTFITQFPCRRTVLVPTITCSDDALNPTNVRTYDLYTYLNQYKETRPIVWSIQVEIYTKAGASDLPTSSDKRAIRQTMMMASNTPLSLPFRGGSPYVKTMAAGGTLVDESNPFMAPQIIPTASNQTPIGGPINVGLGANMNASDLWQLSGGNGYDSFSVWAVINCGALEFNNWTSRIIGGGTPCRCYCNAADYTKAEFREAVRHATACFGMFFTDSTAYAETAQLDDDTMHLGVLDNGIGYGEYTSGEKNTEQPQFGWKTMNESDYDPTNPPEPGGDPAASSDPLLPVGLEWTLAGAGTGIWALTPSNITQIWDDIFGQDINVKQFGDNPMNAILSLEWTPFKWEGGTPGPIILGSTIVNPAHTYPKILTVSHAEVHGSGQMQFKYNKNFYNSRNIQARLFLPFYGYYELPAAQLLSSQLRVDFYYNVPDELGVYIISYDKVIYDFVECNCKIEIPVTGSNAAAIKENKKSEALTIATQVATTAATVGIGYSSMKGLNQALAHVASGVDVVAEEALGYSGGLETAAYLGSKGSGRGMNVGTITGGIAAGIGAGVNVYNTVNQAQIQRAALRTNLPYHGSALQTTFLHMSMKPYVQIFKNAIMKGFTTKDGGTIKEELGGTSKDEYMLKVGHACDIFTTMEEMPENSLLQTTGCANLSSVDMEITEYQELNSILQSGFYK